MERMPTRGQNCGRRVSPVPVQVTCTMESPTQRDHHMRARASVLPLRTLMDVNMIVSMLIALANLMENRHITHSLILIPLTQSHTA